MRERVGDMLGAVAESVVGAPVIRAHAAEARTAARIDEAVERAKTAQVRAQTLAAFTYSAGELTAALANGLVVVVGVLLGVDGSITTGRLVGFLFLVTLFVQPVQVATEVLNEAQNAVAGMRRVLGVLDTPTDVADPRARPGPAGRRRSPSPSRTSRSPTRAVPRCCATSTSRSRRAPGSRSWGRPAAGRRRSPSC